MFFVLVWVFVLFLLLGVCLFVGVVCFIGVWVVFCLVFWCWGGHAKTFLFEKLHAQFAVLQIARTRA